MTNQGSSSSRPRLILVGDGGGSKICVVIRSSDGLEVRGTGGPCNVQSVGYSNAIQAILLATYRALEQLPPGYLPSDLLLPSLPAMSNTRASQSRITSHLGGLVTAPASRQGSRAGSPSPALPLPPIPSHHGLFQYVWCGLAGISTPEDVDAFQSLVVDGLGTSPERVKITNDVNLLAAPALELSGITHAVAVVCGTGTVGRTIAVAPHKRRGNANTLPLIDVGVSRGWGFLLCDEGSAFWMARLAIRSALAAIDRASSSAIYAPDSSPPILPFHQDLLEHFGVSHPMDLISCLALTSSNWEGLGIGEAQARRNATMAGAARVVLSWAFPEEATGLPSPPASEPKESTVSPSQAEAFRIAVASAAPVAELIVECLGDRTVVRPQSTALCLGGGLWNSKGYRELVMGELAKRDIVFGVDILVRDPAGAGASGLARVEFGD